MRCLFSGLMATLALCSPVLADPLRDAAKEFFAPLPATAPEIPGNPATAEKLALGRALFFDAGLSASGATSCASCHDPAKGGQDGLATPKLSDGAEGLRNTSTVLNAMLNDVHFWDGRDEDLAAQADGPMKAGLAMLGTPEAQLAFAKADANYAKMFAAAYPGEADPVTPDTMAGALEVYVASLLTPAPFDAWLAGDDAALSDGAKAGLQAFLDTGCNYCHFGPTLGGSGHYPLGLVENPSTEVLSSDESALYAIEDSATGDFVFRTAPLRNVALTAPYFHSGKVQDLSVAVDIMAESQLGRPLDAEDTARIVEFLQSLTGTAPMP